MTYFPISVKLVKIVPTKVGLSVTRNGDYQLYAKMFRLLEDFFGQLRPLVHLGGSLPTVPKPILC